jgi:hypothetical protein
MKECSNCKNWKVLPSTIRVNDKPNELGTCEIVVTEWTKRLIELDAKSVIGVIHLFSFPYGSCGAWEPKEGSIEEMCQKLKDVRIASNEEDK